MSAARLETFADGVFAIAATLLVLTVDVPSLGAGQSLAHELAKQWPAYAAYVVSFVTIGIIWVNHHTVLDQMRGADRTFLFINVFFLMCVAFIPFPTRLLATYVRTDDGNAAAFAYGVTLTITAIFFNVMWRYAIGNGGRLLRPDADRREVDGITRSYRPGVPMYAGATVVGVFQPEVGALLFAASAGPASAAAATNEATTALTPPRSRRASSRARRRARSPRTSSPPRPGSTARPVSRARTSGSPARTSARCR